MKYSLIALFTGFIAYCNAQNDTIVRYFDLDWNECKEKKATYYSKRLELPDSNFYYTQGKKDRYPSFEGVFKGNDLSTINGFYKKYNYQGNLVYEGNFQNNSKEGNWKYYHNNQNLESEGAYKNNQRAGIWEFYSKDGELNKKCGYLDNKLHGVYEIWSNSTLIDSGRFEENKEVDTWRGFHSNGQLAYEGKFNSKGSKTGVWKYYYENGQLSSQEEFISIDSVKREFYDTSGNLIEYEGEEFIDPKFYGNESALSRYIMQNIEYPEEARENGEQGIAYVGFTIMRDGSIEDVRIMRGVSKSIDEEAVKLVQNMPKWEPGKSYGHPIRVRFTLPIRFTLG